MTTVRQAIEAHLGSRHVTRVIYGSIIGLAVIVGLEPHPPKAVVVIVTLGATALAVALAEVYSDIVGTEVRLRARVGRERARAMFTEGAAVAFGVAFPSVFFALAALDVMEIDTAFGWAKWTGLGLIAFYGLCAGRLAGARWPAALLQAGAVALIGVLLIALKALIH